MLHIHTNSHTRWLMTHCCLVGLVKCFVQNKNKVASYPEQITLWVGKSLLLLQVTKNVTESNEFPTSKNQDALVIKDLDSFCSKVENAIGSISLVPLLCAMAYSLYLCLLSVFPIAYKSNLFCLTDQYAPTMIFYRKCWTEKENDTDWRVCPFCCRAQALFRRLFINGVSTIVYYNQVAPENK